jgi:hypothetical protein
MNIHKIRRLLSSILAFMLLSCFALSFAGVYLVPAQMINPNNLPLCPTPDTSAKSDIEKLRGWTECWGLHVIQSDTKDHSAGDRLEGEWKGGKLDGYGFFNNTFRNKYVGGFRNGKFHGLGRYSVDGLYEHYGIFQNGSENGQGVRIFSNGRRFEGFWENDNFIREEKVNLPNPTNNVPNNSKLSETRREQQRQSQRVNLQVTHTQPTADGSFAISVQTNVDTASLKINGEEQGGRADGKYSMKRVARVGQDTQFTITTVDIYGNSATKTITVARQAESATETPIALKPEAIKRAPSRDAVAIIIGIQDYKRAPKADFANKDAKEFYEYAVRALGVKPDKIRMLIDDDADEVNIVKAFENWLPIQVNKDKTDVYVFYSGHGLPAPDGKSLYFLPHGVDKELLSRTAVSQNDIVAALSAAKPKSVTMFIDACYSGQTRGGDILVANAKPVSLKSDANAYPPNFTVITASANDQISSSSPELKHGIFSFYLMKGMEGEADANKDGKITVGEMQDYLSDKVARQAMTLNRKQTTQLAGDAERVLVSR